MCASQANSSKERYAGRSRSTASLHSNSHTYHGSKGAAETQRANYFVGVPHELTGDKADKANEARAGTTAPAAGQT